MPELPEVESIAQALRDGKLSLLASCVQRVDVLWDGVLSGISVVDFKRRLDRAVFRSIDRHGKYLLFGLDPAGSSVKRFFLVIHLRMTGRLVMSAATDGHDRYNRLSLLLDNGTCLRFDDPRKFGRVWLVDEPSQVTANLGPDALTIGNEEFAVRLAAHQRQLKPLLLDQSFLAGIGNIYADESLFRCGLHPLTNSGDLSSSDVRRLHGAVAAVLKEAVASQGANIDGVFKAGRFIVNVYGRQGQPCPVCATVIVKTRVGQRGTHFCPNCQPAPPGRRNQGSRCLTLPTMVVT